jgi:hypothetical protein
VGWKVEWWDDIVSERSLPSVLRSFFSLSDDEILYLAQLVYRSESDLLYLIYKEAREVIE